MTAAALAAAGCGGGGGGETTQTISAFQKEAKKAEAEAPKGASPVLRAIYRQFPPPKPDPKVKGSGKAIKKGEDACKGKTPLEVREEFIGEADLNEEQAEIVEELPKFESKSSQSASFPAGQLGALVYEKSLPKAVLARYGYMGCVYSLAKGLEKELAPSQTR